MVQSKGQTFKFTEKLIQLTTGASFSFPFPFLADLPFSATAAASLATSLITGPTEDINS